MSSVVRDALRGLRERWAEVAGALGVAFVALMFRFHNLPDVLVEGRFYFVDADCYSRMSRARMILENPGQVVRRQFFENWPEGVASHATAPMDYLIAGLERCVAVVWPVSGRLGVLSGSSLDLAGALVSPLLGVVLCVFLYFWASGLRLGDGARPPGWWTAAALGAVSPPLVHATVFGRPDHQSLLCLLLGVALAAEQRLWSGAAMRWAWAGGLAWGFALWVSLFEPVVLLGLAVLLGVFFGRKGWDIRIRSVWFLALALPVCACALVDGFRVDMPRSTEELTVLKRWGAAIGELQSVQDLAVFSNWLGLLWLPYPVVLFLAFRREGRAPLGWLLFTASALALAAWQVRWSAYAALAFALGMPWIFGVWGSGAVLRGLVFAASLFPVAREWEGRFFPSSEQRFARSLDRSEKINARRAAERMRTGVLEPFLAVWWHSPALAYWSGQPAVAGSGHEGIRGIVDSSRFFLSETPAEAREILEARGVRMVVASDSARAVENAALILKQIPGEGNLAEKLWRPNVGAEWGLQGETNVVNFRLLRVVSPQ